MRWRDWDASLVSGCAAEGSGTSIAPLAPNARTTTSDRKRSSAARAWLYSAAYLPRIAAGWGRLPTGVASHARGRWFETSAPIDRLGLLVLVVAPQPERIAIVLVAPRRGPVEQAVVGHRGLESAR